MAKSHYIGKFSSEAEIQQALDNGLLLKPYVAQYGSEGNEQIDYNSKTETPRGAINLTDLNESSGFTVESLVISADTLYWQIDNHSSDWYGANAGQGYGDYSTDLWINSNEGENSRSGQFTVNFYYDDTYQTLRNSVTITITQEGHIIADGSVDPTGMTLSYYYNQQWITVYGDDLYWVIVNPNNWISVNQYEGQGTSGVLLDIYENPVTTRNGSITVYFYTDSEHQNLKNTATLTIEQAGEGQIKASFSDSEYVDEQNVSSASGSTNVYILNNPGSYYFKVECDGFEATGDPQTTAYTVNYHQATTYDDQNKSVVVTWYWDSEMTDYAGGQWLTLHQPGDKSLSYIVDDETNIPSSGGSKTLEIVMNSNAVSWMIDLSNAESGISFTDYPGESSITGNTSGVSVTVAANSSPNQKGYYVLGWFFDQNGNPLNMGDVWVRQDAFVAGTAVFETGGDMMEVNYDWSGDVVVNITVESGIYFDLQERGGPSIATGDTNASVTAMTVSPNTGSTIQKRFICHFYDDSGMTSEVRSVTLTFRQNEAPIESMFECTFITTADNQTVIVNSCENEFPSAYLNGVNIIGDLVSDGNGHMTYTFPSAGTHTITFTRENDPYLQGWLTETEMVSFYGHSTINWGFWDNVFYGSNNLTAVTLGDTCNQLVASTFTYATGITVMNCYMASDVGVYDYDSHGLFMTISDNNGTLHIPSGATSDYQNIIAGLGSNWTVVDDL